MLQKNNKREGFAIIYRNRPNYPGLDTYLRLAPQATTRHASLDEATMFASKEAALPYAEEFKHAPNSSQEDAEVVAVVEEVIRRHAVPHLTETIKNMMAREKRAC